MERQTGARNVIVGVSGSIAAYKAPSVIRLLRREGHEVRTVATEAALRFIGAPALAAVTGRPVSTGVFDDPAAVEHVEMGEWAELVVVAPASADLLARLAAGRADDLLTATILMTTAPVVLAPAMHTRMWTSPATEENVATLRRRGVSVIPPDAGPLTGGDSGAGRLPEPGRIVSAALAILGAAGDAAFAYVIAHEVGHHVQNLLGILPQVHQMQQQANKTEANRLSVKLELQADCFAGVWAKYAQRQDLLEAGDIEEAVKAAEAVGDDTLQKRSRGYAVPDSFTHGTSEQRMYWLKRGLQSGDIKQCDTFAAE